MANGPGTGQGGTIGAVPRNPAEAAAMEFYGAGYGQGQMMPGSPIDEPDYVWMGDRYTTPIDIPAADLDPIVGNRLNSGWMTMEQAEAEWFVMDPQTKQMVTDYVAQMDDQVPTDERSRYKYTEALRQAQQFTAVYPENPLTVFDVMRRNAENAVQVRAMRGGSGGGGVSRVVNLTNPDDAKSLVNASLQQYLGRDATDEEIAEFTKALNKSERRNPIVTTKTQRSGGVSPAQRAEDFARSQEGAAEFLAETQYSDWFQEAIMASPTEGIASGL